MEYYHIDQHHQGPVQVPIYFHLADTKHIISLVVEMITRLVNHNDSITFSQTQLTRFHSKAPPAISITDYVRRIVKYASIEKASLLLLLVYIDRLCAALPSFTISTLTVHRYINTLFLSVFMPRFLIISITTGSKSISDVYCSNTHFSKVLFQRVSFELWKGWRYWTARTQYAR